MRGCSSITALLFGLALSLASAESPIWTYLTADCWEHRVFYSAPSCPYSLLTPILFLCTARTKLKTRQPF